MSEPLFDVWKEFKLDVAHQLDAGPSGDPRYRRVHGHSYQVKVHLRGPRTQYGWVVDMEALERQLIVVRDLLDHRYLNEIEGLDVPTMENIALFIWVHLQSMPQLNKVSVLRRQNGEGCEYTGPTR